MLDKHLSGAHKKKISKSMLERKERLGYLNSTETRRKISKALKGKHLSKETRIKIGKALKGKKRPLFSKETRKKMSEAKRSKKYTLGYHHTEEVKKKISEANEGHIVSKETRYKMSETHKGIPISEETKKKISEAQKGTKSHRYGKHHTKETREINSKRLKEIWKTSEYVSKQMKARGITPNKTEIWLQNFLNKLYPNEWKFVGDGQIIISGKCPDFINTNGQKKIIELFGDYWHEGEKPQDRIDIFKPFGYKTLVIWEKELKNIEKLKSKIYKFNEVL